MGGGGGFRALQLLGCQDVGSERGGRFRFQGLGLATIIPKGTLKLNLRQDDQMDLSIRLRPFQTLDLGLLKFQALGLL